MKNEYIDLHIHSNKSSDGDLTPFEICEIAKNKGLRAISIADHDTLEAYPEALSAGENNGIEIIPSIELTTSFGGREFHLLLPFLDWTNKEFYGILKKAKELREKEAKKRVEKLMELGFDISWEEVKEKTKTQPPLGVVIAKILLDKEATKKNSSLKKYLEGENKIFAPYRFYQDYFSRGKPAYVPKMYIDIREAIKTGRKHKGVPVLAHPGAYFQHATEEDIKKLKEEGLAGLEVFTFYHNQEQIQYYLEIAKKLNLVPTVGSDFHGRIKPHIKIGELKQGGYWIVEELRKRQE